MKEKEDKPHICKGYVEGEHLPVDQATVKRAQEAGIAKLLLECAENFLTALKQLGIRENNYEEMAKIADVLQDTCRPIQKRFHAPNIEIGSFVSPDTGALNTIYLTEYRIILETVDQINGIEVRDTDTSEIWRYLHPPSKIVENIVSIIIAVAEKHKGIKDDWILSFQRIKDLCLEIGND